MHLENLFHNQRSNLLGQYLLWSASIQDKWLGGVFIDKPQLFGLCPQEDDNIIIRDNIIYLPVKSHIHLKTNLAFKHIRMSKILNILNCYFWLKELYRVVSMITEGIIIAMDRRESGGKQAAGWSQCRCRTFENFRVDQK